ncbi:CYIR protein [Plasmodium cynomolgi strain B]|uniref:CYIR protein n=1 Tax=Plasmodium cynomolgi (strain B) TaxID=1120755 RepID=K6UF91_PLACD|nr:CYIR protein [Plasmodium cynomolgi strain B]GAB69691.1 CYIR protein [Plasmodium cynomolgi strain B]
MYFLYDNKTRIQIKKCPSAQSIIGSSRIILDSGQDDITEVTHYTSPVQSSPDDKPSKPVYYSGLSALGIAFTCMVLYKYTLLRCFMRSLISKKEKLRQTTNKNLSQQWMEKTSE